MGDEVLCFLSMCVCVYVVDFFSRTVLETLPKSLCVPLDTILGHGFLAAAQWLLGARLSGVSTTSSQDLWLALFAGVVSLGMDGDHFLEGGSLSLKSALNLPTRPFAHTVLFFVGILVVATAASSRGFLPPFLPLLLATALAGHQLRDSVRRGFSWGPAVLGGSPPTPYLVYLVVMGLIPLGVSRGLRYQQVNPILPL